MVRYPVFWKNYNPVFWKNYYHPNQGGVKLVLLVDLVHVVGMGNYILMLGLFRKVYIQHII